MEKPTLGYWAIRGLASQVRYQMVYLGVDYQEDIYEQGDAPEFSRACWTDKKNSLGLAFPNLPYFIDGPDIRLTETQAIMKYICYKWGEHLLGKDSAQVGEVEMVAGIISDLKGATTMPCYTSEDKNAIAKICIDKTQPVAAYLGKKSFLMGDNVTYVDFILFELCDFMMWITDGQIFSKYPNLREYFNRVKELPRLREFYLNDAKCIKRPFNNKVAKLNN